MANIARRILAAAPPRFALAGLSMGGFIAFEIMRQAPERVAKLALLDTSSRPDAPEQTERRRMLMRLAQEGRYAEIPEQVFPIYVHRNRHGDEALKRIVREMAEATGIEAYLRQQQAILNRPDIRPALLRFPARRWFWSARATRRHPRSPPARSPPASGDRAGL